MINEFLKNKKENLDDKIKSSVSDFNDQNFYKVPQFDYSILPDVLSDYINECSDVFGVPKNGLMGFMFSAMSSIIGNRICVVSPNSHTIYPAIYSNLIAESGSGKSQTLKLGLGNLLDINNKRVLSYKSKYNKYLEDLEQNKKDKNDFLSTSVAPQKPMSNEIIIDDITWQGLVSSLAYNSKHGMLIKNDELTSLLKKIESEQAVAEKRIYLEAYNGGNFSKKIKGEIFTETADNMLISVAGTTQPDIMQELYTNSDGSGLLARFQLTSISNRSKNKMIMRKVNDNIINNYHDLLTSLSEIDDRFIIDKFDGIVDKGVNQYTLPKDASLSIIDFYENYMEHEFINSDNNLIKEYINKMLNTVHTLSLLLHLADNIQTNVISDYHVDIAIKISKYYYQNIQVLLNSNQSKFDLKFEKLKLYTICNTLKPNKENRYSVNTYYNRRSRIMKNKIKDKEEALLILQLLEENNLVKIEYSSSKVLFSLI